MLQVGSEPCLQTTSNLSWVTVTSLPAVISQVCVNDACILQLQPVFLAPCMPEVVHVFPMSMTSMFNVFSGYTVLNLARPTSMKSRPCRAEATLGSGVYIPLIVLGSLDIVCVRSIVQNRSRSLIEVCGVEKLPLV